MYNIQITHTNFKAIWIIFISIFFLQLKMSEIFSFFFLYFQHKKLWIIIIFFQWKAFSGVLIIKKSTSTNLSNSMNYRKCYVEWDYSTTKRKKIKKYIILKLTLVSIKRWWISIKCKHKSEFCANYLEMIICAIQKSYCFVV